MTTYFVSRHAAAVAWAAGEGFHVDRLVAHIDPDVVQPGDVVIGSLPVNLAGEVCARAGRYLHLSLDLTAELRGKELSVQQMQACGARLEEYRVQRVHRAPAPQTPVVFESGTMPRLL